MAALICGSLAFDTIMTFEGRFAEQILPDQLHILNVSFLVPALRRDFGGCAGNIAYSLKLLGGEPLPMATVGSDGAGYLERLRSLGISTEFVREVGDSFTAQAMIMTDRDNNQITAFHPGAMMQAHTTADHCARARHPAGHHLPRWAGCHAAACPSKFSCCAASLLCSIPARACLCSMVRSWRHSLIRLQRWVTVNDYEGKHAV
jgi:adenosine kinase